MANKRIYQTSDLSGNISPDDLILVDKYLGPASYTTGFKKINDIINNIIQLPTNYFVNINNDINTNANNIVTLDNSIEPRIESFTRLTQSTRYYNFVTVPALGGWVYISPKIKYTISLNSNSITTDDRKIIHIFVRMTGYTLDGSNTITNAKTETRIYMLGLLPSGIYQILNNRVLHNSMTFGPDTNNIRLHNSANISAQIFEIRGGGRQLGTTLYFKTEFITDF